MEPKEIASCMRSFDTVETGRLTCEHSFHRTRGPMWASDEHATCSSCRSRCQHGEAHALPRESDFKMDRADDESNWFVSDDESTWFASDDESNWCPSESRLLSLPVGVFSSMQNNSVVMFLQVNEVSKLGDTCRTTQKMLGPIVPILRKRLVLSRQLRMFLNIRALVRAAPCLLERALGLELHLYDPDSKKHFRLVFGRYGYLNGPLTYMEGTCRNIDEIGPDKYRGPLFFYTTQTTDQLLSVLRRGYNILDEE